MTMETTILAASALAGLNILFLAVLTAHHQKAVDDPVGVDAGQQPEAGQVDDAGSAGLIPAIRAGAVAVATP